MTASGQRALRAGPASGTEPGGVERMCPSTSVANATVFLGMVTPQREVAYLTPAVPVTPAMLETVASSADGSAPLEAQYRFAGPCVTSRCGFWTGSHCGLGERIADTFAEDDSSVAMRMNIPKCAIRGTCRWFAEQGSDVCRACRFVVTDSRSLTAS